MLMEDVRNKVADSEKMEYDVNPNPNKEKFRRGSDLKNDEFKILY